MCKNVYGANVGPEVVLAKTFAKDLAMLKFLDIIKLQAPNA